MSAQAKKTSKCPVAYASSFWVPVAPTFALGSNTDGSNSVSFATPFTLDVAPEHAGDHYTSWTIGPTTSFTDNSKAPIVTFGGPSASPNFGVTSVAAGLLLGYRLQAGLVVEEELGAIAAVAPLRVEAVQACQAHCAANPVDDAFKAFCEAPLAKLNANSVDEATLALCKSGWQQYQDAVKKNQDAAKNGQDSSFATTLNAVTKLRAERIRFPQVDLSLWGGGGASEFNFYQQTAAAAGTTPATFGSSTTTQWKPNFAGAAQLTAVPWTSDGPLGLTFEVPVFAKYAYQASKKTGSPCSSAGSISATTSLTSCGTTAPIGPPTDGTVFTAKGYVGVIDRVNAYWRVAIGGGYSFNSVDSSYTWSIELPLYINATGLGGSTGSATPSAAQNAASASAKSGVQVAYNGIIRITPTVQYSTTTTPGWSAVLNFELLGQRNMFTRADTLVK